MKGRRPPELGDIIAAALARVGITEGRVSGWLRSLGYSHGCGCATRREKLNALGRWAKRVLAGKTERAEEYLRQLTEE